MVLCPRRGEEVYEHLLRYILAGAEKEREGYLEILDPFYIALDPQENCELLLFLPSHSEMPLCC